MNLAAVCVTRRPEMARNLIDNLIRQQCQPDVFVFISHGDVHSPNFIEHLRALRGSLYGKFFFGSVSRHEPYGKILNLAFSVGGAAIGNDGLITTIEDDDYYGKDYFGGLVSAANALPRGAPFVLGKASYMTRWPETEREPELWEDPNENAPRRFCGATIAVDAEKWLSWPDFRYPETPAPVDGGFFVNAWKAWAKREGVYDEAVPAPFVSTGIGDFYAQRYLNKEHGHTWEDRRDHVR